jgi:hypothetical protein
MVMLGDRDESVWELQEGDDSLVLGGWNRDTTKKPRRKSNNSCNDKRSVIKSPLCKDLNSAKEADVEGASFVTTQNVLHRFEERAG